MERKISEIEGSTAYGESGSEVDGTGLTGFGGTRH